MHKRYNVIFSGEFGGINDGIAWQICHQQAVPYAGWYGCPGLPSQAESLPAVRNTFCQPKPA
ncbi:hypothetical protein GCM10007423_00470 [Dyadobacter endophyticus]|uniref:Uncharacterized protein n=1 Tax=Dyadobacter endophyticus TaxID=1749036 RepID=A0ABQ1YCK3_9BACT|nr:hypothetical protein GCM10007423_00470 [Dyadobacter endophyticus]